MRFLKIALGNFFISFAYACITIPKIILNGGVTSFSLVVSHLSQLSVNTLVNGITLFLLALSFIYLGKDYFIGVLFSSLCYILTFNGIYWFKYELPVSFYPSIPLAAFIVSLGYYLCISSKSSAVSFDTIALILNKKSKRFDIAITMSLINIGVLLMGLVVFSLKAVLAGIVFTVLQGLFLKIFLKNHQKKLDEKRKT